MEAHIFLYNLYYAFKQSLYTEGRVFVANVAFTLSWILWAILKLQTNRLYTILCFFQITEQFNHNGKDHYDSGNYCIFKPLIEVDVGKHGLSIEVVVSNIGRDEINNSCQGCIEHWFHNFRQHGTPTLWRRNTVKQF